MKINLFFSFTAIYLLIMAAVPASAREFEVNVSVNVQRLSNDQDRQVLSGLEQAVRDYMGQYKWTDDPTFNSETQIQISLNIIVESSSLSRLFTGQMFISASRRQFGSGRPTSIFRYTDKYLEFEFFSGYQPQHNEQSFDKLASVLDFYSYLILGIEADSYEPKGGEVYFARAAKISALPGTESTIGWLVDPSIDSRKEIVDEFLDPKFSNYRNGFFKYHYDGLDAVTFNPVAGEQGVVDGLKLIDDTLKRYPNSILQRLFFDAKYKEISEFFNQSPPEVKEEVYRLLQRADPSHLSEYQNLR